MITKLLKNAVIVTVNPEREIFYHGAIAIENDRIVDIGDSDVLTEKYKNANEVWDLDGKIIFPGFINTHTHLFQTLLKGIGDDMELKDWLSNMMFPYDVPGIGLSGTGRHLPCSNAGLCGRHPQWYHHHAGLYVSA